jgi:hypothetical protein
LEAKLLHFPRFCRYITDDKKTGIVYGRAATGGLAAEDQLPPNQDAQADHQDQDGANEKEHRDAMVLLFSNLRLAHFRTASEISVDGMFYTAPKPFKQIVFLEAKQASKCAVPVVFAVSPTR